MLPPLLPVSMLATPSIVMLFEFGRWPLTVKPLDLARLRAGGCSARATPGTSSAKLNSVRPLLAMFLSASLSSVNERSPLSVCSSLTRPLTLTLSSMPPTSSVIVPAENLSFALTTTFVRSAVLKPCIVTLSV